MIIKIEKIVALILRWMPRCKGSKVRQLSSIINLVPNMLQEVSVIKLKMLEKVFKIIKLLIKNLTLLRCLT